MAGRKQKQSRTSWTARLKDNPLRGVASRQQANEAADPVGHEHVDGVIAWMIVAVLFRSMPKHF